MDKMMVNIGGEELELRPISARQYLSARMEAEKVSETFGEDQVSKAVLMGAGLLAKSLFYNDERLFASMDDVLDALSAEEIVMTADYIELKPDMKTKIVEKMNKAETLNKENAESDIKAKADVRGNSSFLRRELGQERNSLVTVYSGVQMRTSEFVPSRGFSPRSDMRRVSDFFQRDSRRYDGIIVGY